MIIQFNAKLTPEINEKFKFICDTYGIKKSAFLVSCINSEYDKLTGNPELKNAIQKLTEFAKEMQELSGTFNPK